jgi:glutamate-1-semialdehyde aminotransferase
MQNQRKKIEYLIKEKSKAKMGISQDLYKKSKKLIPGGTQLLTKRPEMFLPDLWPAYYDKANGCEIWDLDGKKYIDMSLMGIGSCILGYADRDVDNAVNKAIERGSMATLNCPEEVELAKLLCNIHPWAKMARFARTGGEAMTVAVRIARAKTGKDVILFCGYHGWSDWYLSANLADDKSLDGHLLPGLKPKGVPRALKGTAIPFNYNDTEGFLKLIKANKKRIAAVVMEPVRNHYPKEGFLETIREITRKEKIVLIFDEITSGWRLYNGGAHLRFKVYPDICVFAKAMSNGYPMAAIIGTKDVMDVAQDSFISSTYWTERIGPVAALATIKKLKENNVPKHLSKIGKTVQEGWTEIAKKYDLDITVSGVYPLSHFTFNYKEPLILKTLFTQFMLEKGFLATTEFYASYAHTEKYIRRYLNTVEDSLYYISRFMKEGTPERLLKSQVCHSGFKRLT